MPLEFLTLLVIGIFIIAALYSAVGHAGASGYIAVMSLMGLSPLVMKPTALALNILVAVIATVQFVRAGHFSWALFWPFAVLAVPCAFVGGYIHLPMQGFKVMVGLVLLYSAVRLLWRTQPDQTTSPPPLGVALLAGACIGFLSGLTGTGGGIFLTPLILFMGWANPKPAAAVSALFYFVEFGGGLVGPFFQYSSLAAVFGLFTFVGGFGWLNRLLFWQSSIGITGY
jgi:uncharacterized protein